MTGFVSSLEEPRRRFLACVTDHGLEHGLRSCDDFIQHFSPRVIMAAIGEDAELRASLLEQTIGIKKKVGLRKSPTSAGDDLQIALEEGVTTPAAIVALFGADHRARCLDGAELWAYLTEPEFWRAARDSEDAWSMGRDHITYILERALAEHLLTPRDIVEGLTLSLLVHHLPEHVLESVLSATLRQARIHEPFSEEELLDVVPPSVLAEHVPLEEIWDRVVVPHIAERHELAVGSPRRNAPGPPLSPTATRIAPTPAAVPSRLSASRLVGMPMPSSKITGRLAPVPGTRSEAAEPSATKRASRAPRRSIPPKH